MDSNNASFLIIPQHNDHTSEEQVLCRPQFSLAAFLQFYAIHVAPTRLVWYEVQIPVLDFD